MTSAHGYACTPQRARDGRCHQSESGRASPVPPGWYAAARAGPSCLSTGWELSSEAPTHPPCPGCAQDPAALSDPAQESQVSLALLSTHVPTGARED